MIYLVKAGETGGFLDERSSRSPTNFEAEVEAARHHQVGADLPGHRAHHRDRSASSACSSSSCPIFKKMFEDLGGELPLPDAGPRRAVREHDLARADDRRGHASSSRSGGGRTSTPRRCAAVVDPLKLQLPVFGKILKKLSIARFTRNFSTMMASGVPILQSLAIVGETSGNYRHRAGPAEGVRSRSGRASRSPARWPRSRSSRPWSCR